MTTERTTHTPGPWRAEGWESTIVNDADGNTLCLMPSSDGTLASAKANARLIAAAPDMLDALRRADHLASIAAPNGAAHRIIRAAIAKATGDA